MFGPKREEVMGELRKLHNEGIISLCSLCTFVRVNKSRWIR
jgi:hypothetical protein